MAVDTLVPSDVATSTMFDWIAIDDMFVAPYGRPFSQKKVDGLRKRWDSNALGVLYVSYRHESNNYALLDGQHRKVAAEQEGLSKLPCRIYIDLTYEEEALLYVRFATVNKQNAVDRFRARLEAKDLIASEIRTIVTTSCEMDISMVSKGEPGKINAVDALERIYHQYGAQALRETCVLISATWDVQSRAWIAPMLRGVASFWVRYHEVCKYKTLVEKLQCVSPEQVIAKSSLKKAALSQAESESAVGRVLADIYNANMRAGKLPDWKVIALSDAEKARRSKAAKTGNLKRGNGPERQAQ